MSFRKSDNIQEQDVQPQEEKKINFLVNHVVRHDIKSPNGKPGKRANNGDLAKTAYREMLAKNRSLLDSADRVFADTATSASIRDERTDYQTKTQAANSVNSEKDPGKALPLLRSRIVAANALLKASGKRDKRLVAHRQLRGQEDQHRELGGDLAQVKRTYVAEGTAKQLQKSLPGANAPLFVPVLTAIGDLETAKRGIKSDIPIQGQQATDIRTKCDDLIKAAQAYLDQVDQIDPNADPKIKAALAAKIRVCESMIKQARHLAMAVEFDALPKPTKANPWDEETQIRATGLRTALAFERGNQPATGLEGGGASTAYWIREKDPQSIADGLKLNAQPGSGERLFIFKPTEGEEAANGSNDRKGAGAVKEALASGNARLFAQQTGIDLGVPETGVVSVSQSALEGGDPSQPPMIGSAQMNAGGNVRELRETPPDVLARVPKEDVHKIALMDIMSLSLDRHAGNVMIDTADPNTPRMIPIDHGASLPARADFNEMRKRFAGIRTTSAGNAEVVNTTLKSPAAFEPFDPKMVAQLQQLDPDEMEAGMKRQRDALGQVHPGLAPEDKVGDDSFQMSKRAMMFTKLAAKTLSPAEVQLALAARGEELFDAPDDQFGALAQQVIADQQPKKASYQEVLGMPPELQVRVANWLRTNGWVVLDGVGGADPDAFLMRDPATALKLYKSGTANNAPPQPPDLPSRVNLQPAPNMPADDVKQTIVQAFPQVKRPTNDQQWKSAAAAWTRIGQLGGANAYQAALDATEAPAETSFNGVVNTLVAWEKVQQQGARNAIVTGKVNTSAFDILRAALAKDAVTQQNAQLLNAAQNAGGQITDDASRTASVNAFVQELTLILAKFKDNSLAQPLTQQVGDAQQKSQDGDPAGAEKDLLALWSAVQDAYKTDMAARYAKVVNKIRALADQKIWPQGASKALEMRGLGANETAIANGETIQKIEQFLGSGKNLYKQLKAAPDDPNPPVPQPNAPQQPQVDDDDDDSDQQIAAVDQGEDAFQDEEREDDDTDQAQPLAAFDWRESSARNVVKLAISQGLFKKQKTALGDNIRDVKKARKAVAELKVTSSADRKLKLSRNLYDAYNMFGIFVASKLRQLSGAPAWQAYCNKAADEVQNQVAATRAKLKQLEPNGDW